MKKIGEALETAFEGILWAVPLSWVFSWVFFVTRVGWVAVPFAVLPIICAYQLGANRGYRKWKRFMEKQS